MKQGSYRIRWKNAMTGNIEEARLDVERRDIFVSSDMLSDSIYYRIHMDHEWRLDSFEVTQDNVVRFHMQHKQNGMWVDRLEKTVVSELQGIDFFDLPFTPMTHMLAKKQLMLAEGESRRLLVAYFDLERAEYYPVEQEYTWLAPDQILFRSGDDERTIDFNAEGMITRESGRFEMVDFQIW